MKNQKLSGATAAATAIVQVHSFAVAHDELGGFAAEELKFSSN